MPLAYATDHQFGVSLPMPDLNQRTRTQKSCVARGTVETWRFLIVIAVLTQL